MKLGTRADIRIGRVRHQNSAGMQYHSGRGISSVIKTSSRRKRQKTEGATAVERSVCGSHLNYLIFSTALLKRASERASKTITKVYDEFVGP